MTPIHRKRPPLGLLLVFCCWFSLSFSGSAFAQVPPEGLLLPLGSNLPLLLQDEVNTQTAVVGQPVSAWVSQDIYMGTQLLLSRNDRVLGQVAQVEAPVKGRNAIIRLQFQTLVLANGGQLPLSCSVSTGQNSGYWGGEATPGTEPQIVPYNVFRIGTYNRVIYGGEREMGKHIQFFPGTRLVITLQSPLRLYSQSDPMP